MQKNSSLKIFISGRFSEKWLEKFRANYDVIYHELHDSADNLPSDELVEMSKSCQVFITEADEMPRSMLEKMTDLAVIVDCRGNPVNIDIEAATELGITVINTPARNAVAVAELTIAMMIIAGRNVFPSVNAMNRNEWQEKGIYHNYLTYQGLEVYDKTIGLVGMGAIGREIAKRLQPFGVRVLGYDPYVKPDALEPLGVKLVEMDKLLKESDFVSLHVPVNSATTGMIAAKQFDQMKDSAWFINTARAALTVEEDLMKALTEKKIAGAALDVFHNEPLAADNPLLKMDNVICLPHLGGASKEVIHHQSRIGYESFCAFLEGKLVNVVNPDAVERSRKKIS